MPSGALRIARWPTSKPAPRQPVRLFVEGTLLSDLPSQTPPQHGDRRVVWAVLLGIVAYVLLMLLEPLVRPVRHRGRTKADTALRNIAIAVQAYATRYGGWTPAGGDQDDRSPAASWQTQLLPFLERSDLYDPLRFDQPWDQGGNARIAGTSVAHFLNPDIANRAAVNGFAITHQAANSWVFEPDHGIQLDNLRDGSTCTILIGEIGSGFPPWASPGNVRDPVRGLGLGPDQFGCPGRDVTNFYFVGGNGKTVSNSISKRVLELLADPNNGDPLHDEF